jgi:hypothetical protein
MFPSARGARAETLSKKAIHSADREVLLTMAQRWLELADLTHEFHWPDKLERQAEDQRRH